jgi:hypothetical protein
VGFVCSVCGEFHAERMLDIRLSLPDAIWSLGEEERERRASLGDDFAVLDDERFFVRGLLEIPIPDLEVRFGYGVWTEVAMSDFQELLRRWRDPDQAPAVDSILANELAPYVATTGLAARLEPVSADRLPRVELADSDHPLVTDQRIGISAGRSDELAATVLHH